MSGVGVTWYTWMEQGRDISASAQVIALQMFQLRLVDQPGLITLIQVPANETSLGRVRSLLADEPASTPAAPPWPPG